MKTLVRDPYEIGIAIPPLGNYECNTKNLYYLAQTVCPGFYEASRNHFDANIILSCGHSSFVFDKLKFIATIYVKSFTMVEQSEHNLKLP